MNEHWRIEASKRFPEFADRVNDSQSPYLLWFDLREAFKRAYKNSPRDEQMIKRVYEFSDWCFDQPQGLTAADDLWTCVAVTFYEHIPEVPEALEDMPRWFSREDVMTMKDTFSYQVGEAGFQRILGAFDSYREKVLAKFPPAKKR